ncbi:MAG: restriction endonuclease subunit S [Phycisphaerales bacterium]
MSPATSAAPEVERGEASGIRFMRADECLDEVWQGIGAAWKGRPLYGASRSGLTPAKEAIGKHPERYKAVEPGTVFYNPMRILLGSIAMLDDGEAPGITSPDYVVVRGRPGVLHHRVFYYWLRSTAGEQLIRDLARGGVRERILFNRLCEGRLPVPPWPVQERLAEQLAIVPRARAAAAQRLDAAESLPAALLRDVFEGPQASGWEMMRLGDVAFVSGGVQKSPGRAPREHHRPYLTVRNVQRGFLDLTSVERFEVTPSELERLRLQRGDILIVEGNGSPDHIGRNAVFDLDGEEWVHQNHVIRVRLGERASHHYVSTYLNSPAGKAQMMEKARSTSGLYTLSTEKVNSLQVPIPDLPTQHRIAADLSARFAAAEGVIARCREELAAIEALPAALLRDAFGGSTTSGDTP